MNASNRVIYNTLVLYAKMILTVGITLYSVRLILNALGASDYGIYNVVGGVISALSFMQSAMTVSTQRYMSYYKGTQDISKQETIFGSSVILHLGLGFLIMLILFFIQPLIFNHFLNIPEERISIAGTIYYFMSFSMFCAISSVPFIASLNAHENMLYIAIIGIIQVLLTLFLAIYLSFSTVDRLLLYGIGSCCIQFIILILYAACCTKKYEECNIHAVRTPNKKMIKELLSFTGWNTFGALSGISKSQGVAIVLNLFMGTIVNAAYGIANQISGQLNFFSNTMLKAINPQIMQSEGANNRERMLRLSIIASKFGFYLIALFAIPVMFEISSILAWWLKVVPDNTVMFCQMILLSIMINQLTIGLQSAIQATGKIKNYMIFVGGTKIMMIPVAFLLLKFDLPLISVMIAYVVFEFTASILRLICLKIYGQLSIKHFIRSTFLKEALPVLGIVLSGIILCNFWNFNYRFMISIPVMMSVFGCFIYLGGLSNDEKNILKRLFKSIKTKFIKA
jgi:O-antigen/teichoic acid export membrane protein